MSDNRLRNAVSPYLRQHADNPVDWREWGQAAFAEARERQVPVFVSIGYATCHWCHVMARESFQDPEIAAQLRQDFVAVKVDREERPDVDASAMASAAAFTESLGWPLSVFMTPDARVFYAGTYYPPTPVGAHPSFRQVLDAVTEAWHERRTDVETTAAAIANAVASGSAEPRDGAVSLAASEGDGLIRPPADLPSVAEIRSVVERVARAEDREYAGFGMAPKFPNAPFLEFLVDAGLDGDQRSLDLVDRTMTAIAGSSLRDIDGGIFRYATRRDWSVPHYERMLYDNAGLLAVAAKLAIARPTSVGADLARGIAAFLRTTLRVPDGPAAGAFFAAQDSESTIDGKRVEGEWYRLSPEARREIAPPPLDDQVLTGWNGLAIRALAIAGTALADDVMLLMAREAADAIIAAHLADGHVTVRSSTPRGVSPALPQLEDVGLLAEGLIELALATGDVRYATIGRALVADGLEARLPSDPLLTAAGTNTGERPQTALRSGTAGLAAAALLLGQLSGEERPVERAAGLVRRQAHNGLSEPLGYADAIGVALALQRRSREVVIVTSTDNNASSAVDSGDEGLRMRAAAGRARRPGTITVLVSPHQAREWAIEGFELLADRDALDPAAYVCHGHVCALPARTTASLRATLGAPTDTTADEHASDFPS